MRNRIVAVDMVGGKFGRLTVLDVFRKPDGREWLRCRCDCGNDCNVQKKQVAYGLAKSCGCFRKETSAAQGKKNAVHGMKKSSEYSSWRAMRKRCFDKHCERYREYGARGITVCDRWNESFVAFLADMGPKPTPQHTIDRYPDKAGNYEPGNCRWATVQEQIDNRRPRTKFAGRLLTIDGVSKRISEWSLVSGICSTQIYRRLSLGFSDKDAVFARFRNRKRVK